MSMQRELSSFPIAPGHKVKLSSAGFVTVDDLKGVKPTALAKELSISNEEALEIVKTVFPPDTHPPNTSKNGHLKCSRSALDILREEQASPNIITFSEQLDLMLGGGIPVGKITEFCGAPGIGKTQICLQLAVDAQLPDCFGGLHGEVVYVDTEGSFIVERLVDIASATVKHCQQITRLENNPEQVEAMKDFTLEGILSGIHYFRCHNHVELLATVHLLPEFIIKHPQVKLLIIDSIAFHFRHGFEDLSLRTRLLTGMAQSFIRLAAEHRLAVVLTNQMSTRFANSKTGLQSHLIPALGESWGHASTLRVILYWEENQRFALLYKSPSKKEAVVPYQVTMAGIRDVCSQKQEDALTDHGTDSEEPDSKRQRIT